MKTPKILSLTILIALFTNSVVVSQSIQELDYDKELTKLEMKAENPSTMSKEQYDKLMDKINEIEREKENRCETVFRLIDGLSEQQHIGSTLNKTPNTFGDYITKLNYHIDKNKLSDAQVLFIIQEINTEYNLYDKLIANGHDESLAIVSKAKQFHDKTTVYKPGFEIFKSNYTSWIKTRKPETLQRSADQRKME